AFRLHAHHAGPARLHRLVARPCHRPHAAAFRVLRPLHVRPLRGVPPPTPDLVLLPPAGVPPPDLRRVLVRQRGPLVGHRAADALAGRRRPRVRGGPGRRRAGRRARRRRGLLLLLPRAVLRVLRARRHVPRGVRAPAAVGVVSHRRAPQAGRAAAVGGRVAVRGLARRQNGIRRGGRAPRRPGRRPAAAAPARRVVRARPRPRRRIMLPSVQARGPRVRSPGVLPAPGHQGGHAFLSRASGDRRGLGVRQPAALGVVLAKRVPVPRRRLEAVLARRRDRLGGEE
ncbi:MAG: hypothetical protein BJ554DRAFT_8427, partial [Olpidium bornovanus]